MSRRRKKRGHPVQLTILLVLLAVLAGIVLLELGRAGRAPVESVPTETPAPETTPEPTPEPTSEPTPSPTPQPTPEPTPEPTPDGRYHTGDPELDEMLYAIVEEQTDESMSDEEKLHALFLYVCTDNFHYLRRNSYALGETGWENAEAKTMLTEKKGNCYNFAATFCLLARCIGYDAVAYSGTIYGQQEDWQPVPPDRPHGWVEINIDGVDYIFDPDMQYTMAGWYKDDTFYMQDDGIRNQYGYTKEAAELETEDSSASAEEVTENP